MDTPLCQYELLLQTIHGTSHSMKYTTGQFKISDMWFKLVVCPNTPLTSDSQNTHEIHIQAPTACTRICRLRLAAMWKLGGGRNDKVYYSVSLSSTKWAIFFDTVHNAV